jgi:hypothetical protein
MDPLSLLCRLAAAVPYPRFSPFGDHEARHTVRYSGVLASASKMRKEIAPKQASVLKTCRKACMMHWNVRCQSAAPIAHELSFQNAHFTLTFCNARSAKVECVYSPCSHKTES